MEGPVVVYNLQLKFQNLRLAMRGVVDCRPPTRVPYAFQELVQNSCTRVMANGFTGELENQTEWAERLRKK